LNYYDIPDTDSGIKDIVLTLDGAAPYRAIGFAVINLAASGAEEDSATNVFTATISSPVTTPTNITAPAISIMFSMCDDADTLFPPNGLISDVWRFQKSVDGNKQLSIGRDYLTVADFHINGVQYGAATKTFIAATADFAD
jgi:hypothetical protein